MCRRQPDELDEPKGEDDAKKKQPKSVTWRLRERWEKSGAVMYIVMCWCKAGNL